MSGEHEGRGQSWDVFTVQVLCPLQHEEIPAGDNGSSHGFFVHSDCHSFHEPVLVALSLQLPVTYVHHHHREALSTDDMNNPSNVSISPLVPVLMKSVGLWEQFFQILSNIIGDGLW